VKPTYLVHFLVNVIHQKHKTGHDTSVPFYVWVNIWILTTVDDVTILHLIHPSYGITDRSGAYISEYCTSTAVEIRVTVYSSNCSGYNLLQVVVLLRDCSVQVLLYWKCPLLLAL
jgi:hypothetical protein